MKSTFVVLSLVLCIIASPVFAATINVPADQPTIQDGVNSAVNGDIVLVGPGKYIENINFNGKAITVASSAGPARTAIAGAGGGAVVSFASGEGRQSVIKGFTIENGGGGVYVHFSSPLIIGNLIRSNTADLGGGIYVRGSVSPGAEILGNTITENIAYEFGGGIALDGAGTVMIENNKITTNDSQIQGGAIWIHGEADEIIVQNVMVGDGAPSGTEIYSLVDQSITGFRLISNTILSVNRYADGAVVADGFNTNAEIINNLIVSQNKGTGLLCNPSYNDGPPIVQYNDAFSFIGTAYSGSCSGFSGSNGNISVNPILVKPAVGNYHLQVGSPAIDAGSNSAPDLPKNDFAGNPRIVDGNGDGNAIIDMGAYEFQPQ